MKKTKKEKNLIIREEFHDLRNVEDVPYAYFHYDLCEKVSSSDVSTDSYSYYDTSSDSDNDTSPNSTSDSTSTELVHRMFTNIDLPTIDECVALMGRCLWCRKFEEDCTCDDDYNEIVYGSPSDYETSGEEYSENSSSDVEDICVQSGPVKDYFTDLLDTFPSCDFKSLIGNTISVQQLHDITDYIEIFIMFFRDVYCSKSREDLLFAILHALKHKQRGSLISSDVYSLAVDILNNAFGLSIQAGFEFNENSFDFIIDGYDKIVNSEIVNRIQETFAYIVSFSSLQCLNIDPIFHKKYFHDFSHKLSEQPFVFGSELIISILKLFKMALSKAKIYQATGSFETIFDDDSRISQWLSTYDKVYERSSCLDNPEFFGFSLEEYEYDCKHLISEGEIINSHKNILSHYHQKLLSNRLSQIKDLYNSFKILQISKNKRAPPLSLLVYGASSVGKSSFLQILFHHFAKVSNILGHPLQEEDHYMYTRTCSDEYWSGFSTYQWCILLDDIAIGLPSKVVEDKTLDEIIRISNNVPYIPPKADLSEKGKCPVNPKLFLGSTNVKDLNASAWFSVPIATQRRFKYVITVEPKDEFAFYTESGEKMLDEEKANEAHSQGYDNFWHIVVQRTLPGGCVGNNNARVCATYKTILDTCEISEFVKFYGTIICQYYKQCEKMDDATSHYRDAIVCSTCLGVNCSCDVIIQGSPSVLPYSSLNVWRIFLYGFYLPWLAFFAFICYISGYTCGYEYFNRSIDVTFTKIITLIMYLSAKRATRALQPSNKIGLLIGTITIVISIYSMYKITSRLCTSQPVKYAEGMEIKTTPQGTIADAFLGKPPTPSNNEYENMWKWREPTVLTSADFSKTLLSAGSLTQEQQLERIKNNLYTMRVYSDDGTYINGHCTALIGQLYMTNAHYFKDGWSSVILYTSAQHQSLGTQRKVKLTPQDMIYTANQDIAIFRVRDLPPNRGIHDLLMNTQIDLPETNGWFLQRDDKTGSVIQKKVIKIKSSITRIKDGSMDITPAIFSMQPVDFVTVYGDCGSLYVGKFNKTLVILGMHVARNHLSNDVYAVKLDRALINAMIDRFPNQARVQGSLPLVDSKNIVAPSIGVVHPKSPLNFVEGNVRVYGSVTYRDGNKSRVGKTLLCSQLVERTTQDGDLSILDIMHPPVMKGWKPKYLSLKEMVSTYQDTNINILTKCTDAYINDIITSLPKDEIDLISVLDLDTAVNGADCVSYIDGIKRSTSAGFPWRKPKKQFLDFKLDEEGDLTDKVNLVPEMEERVNMIESLYLNNTRFCPMYAATLKDEPVSLSKVEQGKTRVFCAAPMDYTIVVRKLYLPIIRVMQRNKLLFETGVGCQVQTSEWDDFYQYLTHFGCDRIVAGDYSKYDKKMAPCFILEAFRVLRTLAEKAGYSIEQLKAMDCVSLDTAFPNIDYFGDYIETRGTNPSGHPLTVIVNSIVNSLYMRYAYVSINSSSNLSDFKQYVNLLTYGDDNIMGISPQIPWFNHTAIQDSLAAIGVVYTMADKESISKPYINISEASFLKRRFVYSKDHGKIVCPIEHASISKMLTSCVHNKEYVPEQHMMSVFRSAMGEYFWYGRSIYDDRRQKFLSIVNEEGYGVFVEDSTFPLFDFLLEAYEEASLKRNH